jgi:hypothetical protein
MGAARWVNLSLGAWLFVSAFIWRHGPAQFSNTWMLGLIIGGLAFVAATYPAIRIVNVVAAVWLFVSTLLLPGANSLTVVHNCVLAVLVFFAALTPGRFGRTQPSGPRP